MGLFSNSAAFPGYLHRRPPVRGLFPGHRGVSSLSEKV
jgi:hypothetical protein